MFASPLRPTSPVKLALTQNVGSSHTVGFTVETDFGDRGWCPQLPWGAKNGMADFTLVYFHPLQPTDERAQRTGQMATGRAGDKAVV